MTSEIKKTALKYCVIIIPGTSEDKIPSGINLGKYILIIYDIKQLIDRTIDKWIDR